VIRRRLLAPDLPLARALWRINFPLWIGLLTDTSSCWL